MRITSLSYSALANNRMTISWTGSASLLAWIFRNGEKLAGPVSFTSTSKTYDVPMNAGEVAAIEVHEAPAGVVVEASQPAPIARPWINWSAVDDASAYHVYRKRVAGTEYLIISAAHNDETAAYSQRCPKDLGEGWHLFRVEAATDTGAESARTPWAARAHMLPPAPAGVSVAGGSGVFSIGLFPRISRYIALTSKLSLA